MLRLIIILLFLIASVWLGLSIIQHPGYLFIIYQSWIVQMPLWFGIVVVIVSFILFYLLLDGIDRIQWLWFHFKNWLRFRREHQSFSKTQHGLALLIEARWKKAERMLLEGTKQSIEPLMNYLGAAKAAHEQNAFDRRDQYIQMAYQIAPRADLAIGLTQAEFELEQNQLEQAQATLNRLYHTNPRHPRILKLLEKIYLRLGDWKNLLNILPNMRKAKILTPLQIEQFEKNIYCELFNAASLKNKEEIYALWKDSPRAMRKNSDVIYAYVKQLLRFTDTSKEIEALIRQVLKKQWQPQLVLIYGTLPFVNLNRQLVIVGAWLKIYGTRPELLLTLGRLCARNKLWGRAKDYFEKCLEVGPNEEAALEYGKLLQQLNKFDEAITIYRDNLTNSLISKEKQKTGQN